MARSLLIALLVALLGVAPAAAAPQRSALRTSKAVPRLCHDKPLAGASGVAVEHWTAPATGLVRVALEGTRFSDWDLAVFGSQGQRLGASTSFGAAEQAVARVQAGDKLLVQACRLSGGPSVPLAVELFPGGPAGPEERAQLVDVPLSGPSDLARLEALGLDVTHAHDHEHAKVVVYSAAERERLSRAGFSPATVIPDLPAVDRADRRAELVEPIRTRALPSARTTYRQLQDYTTEMKALADQNPGLVRKLTLPLPTLENRPIEGVEIASSVNRTDDGRPVYLQMGAHHAREWPSAEFPMEFALDLVKRFREGDARVRTMLNKVRVIVVPVVNPDGFAVSRGAGTSPLDEDDDATLALALNDQAAYKRKNCRPSVPGSESLPCAMRSNSGVDLNRNYGAYWGGPGSSSDVTTQSYRGPAPYSEPEAEAVHRLTARLHVVTFITNHTFTDDGKFLRQPGFDAPFLTETDGNGNRITPDEAGMKALGDAMGNATGWTSELGYETLGDITGATEDWNYFSQGTYGYTPEARGPNFHANYSDHVIDEYNGTGAQAGQGVYEAFLRAGEQAASPAGHSVIEGTAGARRVLRLKKQFTTETSMTGLVINDTLDTTMTVPSGGSYEWHVNPSKRPLFASSSEVWTMTCEDLSGNVLATAPVTVARGQTVTQDLTCSDGPLPPATPGGSKTPAAPGGSTAAPACDRPTGRLAAKSVDRARLGRKRATNRSRFRKGGRKRASVDTFCFTDRKNLRIGYPSARLLRTLSASNRRRTRGRAVLLLTSSPKFSAAGIEPGDSLAALRARHRLGRGFRVGANTWYLVRGRRARLVFKVRGAAVREVGLADSGLTSGRRAARRFLNSFR